MNMQDRLIVALDVQGVHAARALVARLGQTVRFYKIGMALFFDPGMPALLDDLIAAGNQVFLDYKMYDIPQTVHRGVAAVAARGARIVTVHGDPEILAAATEAARGTGLLVFAVTVLTSQDEASLRAMGYSLTVPELVALRVRAARAAGAAGVIASGADNPDALRTMAGGQLLVATPGIRLAGGEPGDQRRVATPDQAIEQGADFLVLGRPITQAADPRSVAHEVLRLMQEGWDRRGRPVSEPQA